VLVTLGLFGSALLYGDAMITPAISVLSAAEGIHVAAPVLRGYVVTITVGILTALFFFRSTARPGLDRFSGR
jgi:KUP system potassium uptake protein